MNRKLQLFIILAPLLLFLGLLAFLWRGLYLQPEVLPSPLIGKPLPAFRLSNLLAPSYPFTEQALKGKVSLLNIWASWCAACEIEHPMLLKIKKLYNLPIYGIAYKDEPKNTKRFLAEFGNPYTMVGNDSTGAVAMDLGVYGTPETFLVDKMGTIILRHIGVLDEEVWEREFLPLIQSLQ